MYSQNKTIYIVACHIVVACDSANVGLSAIQMAFKLLASETSSMLATRLLASDWPRQQPAGARQRLPSQSPRGAWVAVPSRWPSPVEQQQPVLALVLDKC